MLLWASHSCWLIIIIFLGSLWFLIKNDFQILTSPWWDGFLSGGVCWTPPLSYKSNASIQTGLHFFYFSINCLSGVRYNSEERVWRQVHYIANLRCTVHVGQSQATFVLSRSASLTSQKPDQYHFNWTNAFTWHFIKGFCPTFTPVLSWTPLPFTVLAKIVKPFFRIYVFHRRKLQVWWKYMKLSKLPLLFLGDLSL